MNSLLPSALIIGIDNFVAAKLAEELVNKDISVIGVGNFVSDLGNLNNFSWMSDISEVEGNFNYIFDFEGDLSIWKENKIKGEKISFVTIDDEELAEKLKFDLVSLDFNWRLIEAFGVYGAGMAPQLRGGNWLTDILRLAVKNKNLEIPLSEQKLNLLEGSDLVDAILRASFLSNTEKENFLILGKKINSEDLARILIDKAKMTKLKVFQKEIEVFKDEGNRAEESEKKLRWSPKINFEDGVEETLQYFFSKMDDENRKKKKENQNFGPKVEEINHLKMEVVVENEKEEIKEIKKEEIVEEETIEEESEDFWEIPKFEVNKKKEDKKIFLDQNSPILVDSTPVHQVDKYSVEKDESLSGGKVKKRNNWFWLGLLFLGLLLFLIIPIDWGLSTYLTIKNIKNIPELIKTKKYAKASEMVNSDLNKVMVMDEKINDWGLNGLNWFRNYQNSLKVMGDLLEVEKRSIDLVKSADLVMGGIFEGKEIDWEVDLKSIKNNLMDLNDRLGVLQARLTGDLSWLPSKWKMEVQKQTEDLVSIKKQIGFGIEAIDILPEFLGLDDKTRKYLVLFQNESELRATGGFIGSYGILSFQKGKLVDLEIKDIYEADGQLQGHVEPPVEIKNYLGEANWYMRDANWKADFVETSTDIQWFFKKETGNQVDGVIGIDLASAKSILGVIGEVYVPDFDEKINKDNLYEQAEFYAEKKFFPGSNQKASFLGGLGKQMFEEIKNLAMTKKIEMMGNLIDLLEKNEVQIALNNQESAKKMTDLGWSGEIYKGICGTENCVMDYLYVVESNLGVNKANYFLYRNIEQAVDISNGSLSRILKISYENTAKNTNWPGGDYKNYVRIYLPKDINLSQVTVMDGLDTTIKKIYKGSDLRIREVDGKKEIGFLMTVPVTKKRIVEVRYTSNLDLGAKTKFSYINYIQKQPGSGETGLVNLVSFPDNWQPMQVQPSASLVGGKLLFNQKLDKDIKMGVELEK
ncbi:MAG: DUF4012 domain-containing protein [Candidatus Shapirobacteria bacterium]|nr:DUF4012 domain-containing protein [Candidatus Shapirobacteria bacterium]